MAKKRQKRVLFSLSTFRYCGIALVHPQAQEWVLFFGNNNQRFAKRKYDFLNFAVYCCEKLKGVGFNKISQPTGSNALQIVYRSSYVDSQTKYIIDSFTPVS